MCPKCNFHNYRSKAICPQCSTPMPPGGNPPPPQEGVVGGEPEKKRRSKWDEGGKVPDWLADLMPDANKVAKPPPGISPENYKVIKLEGAQVRALIGKGGETIKGIRERSGADIKIEHVPTDPEGTATIIGDVAKTEELIKETLLSKGYPLLPPGERKMHLLPGGMPTIAGANGAAGGLPGGPPMLMAPPGGMMPPAGGMQAQLGLPPMAGGAGMFPPAARPQGTDPNADVEVPAELVQLLIGPGGANLKDIRARTGDRVYISVLPASMPGGPQYLRCVGEASEMAKGLVRAKLGELGVPQPQLQPQLQPQMQMPSFGAGTPGLRPMLAQPGLKGGGCGPQVISGAFGKAIMAPPSGPLGGGCQFRGPTQPAMAQFTVPSQAGPGGQFGGPPQIVARPMRPWGGASGEGGGPIGPCGGGPLRPYGGTPCGGPRVVLPQSGMPMRPPAMQTQQPYGGYM